MLRTILKAIRARWSNQSNIEQLKADLDAERARRKFERAASEREIAALIREMGQLQAELSRRGMETVIPPPASPSETKH